MRLESILWTIQKVSGGKDTLYALSKEKSRVVYGYLEYCIKEGLLEKGVDRNKRPYKLTPKGRKLLSIFERGP